MVTRGQSRRDGCLRLLRQGGVDLCAPRAHRSIWLGLAGDRERLAAERHDVGAHDGALGDLLLAYVVKQAVVGVHVGILRAHLGFCRHGPHDATIGRHGYRSGTVTVDEPRRSLHVARVVADALAAGVPVVALESTLISHGLPRPDNLSVARQVDAVVRQHGAVPATVGVIAGRLIVGLSENELQHLASDDDVVKLGIRDLAPAVVQGRSGATTVASTARAAVAAGIDVFATGGLGGVHRRARETWDESADLTALATTPVTVVCAGVKSILDVGATLERLESLSIGLVGYRTDRFPGFYLSDSGFAVPWRVDSAEQIAALMRTRAELGASNAALVVGNPLPEDHQIEPALHERVLADALAAAAEAQVTGKDVTPYLLAHFHRATRGRSLEANVAIIVGNAALAADIAVAAARAR